MAALKRIGVLAHPLRPQSAPVAENIQDSLQARGIETWLYTNWDENDVLPQVRTADMVIAIGGDGAMLRAARVCAPFAVPVLGVNMGQLGFLTEIRSLDTWEDHLEMLLRGDYWIESRMMIRASVLRAGVAIAEEDALNDVAIRQGITVRTIRLKTLIDGEWATTYNADGIVIATATGSTAYALALGGPILPPELRNILIVPIAPHLSLNIPIVLSEGATVEVEPSEDMQAEIVLAVDGTVVKCEVLAGDRVRVQASDHVSRFVRLRERNYFYRSLLDRLEPRIPVRSEPERKQI